jgi:hypothetical protein
MPADAQARLPQRHHQHGLYELPGTALLQQLRLLTLGLDLLVLPNTGWRPARSRDARWRPS